MRRSGLIRALLTCAIALVAALFAVTAAQAATYAVHNTADISDAGIDGTCDAGGTDGCTLRAAIDEANASPENDTIVLDAGRYKITQAGEDDNNNTGDFDVANSGTLSIAGATSDPRDTVVSGNGEDRVFQALDGSNLSLSDLTVTDGNPQSGGGGGIHVGGGIREFNGSATEITAATLTLTNTNVVNNVTGDSGGGIYSECDSSITLERSHVDRNTAYYGGGGIQSCGDLTATDSTVDGNNSTQGAGGGIYAADGDVTMHGTSVSGNRAYDGSAGGIYASYNANSVALVDGTVNDNTAYYSGGGIYTNAGTLDLTRTSVTDNSAQTGGGGGIYDNEDDLTITDSTIHSNTATAGNGGGIYATYTTLTVAGTDITSNQAHNDGGGIYAYYTDVSVSGSTIDDNGDQSSYCDSGGGIYGTYGQKLDVSGSSVSGNGSRGDGGGIYWYGDATITDSNVDHNNSDNSDGGGIYSSQGLLQVTRSSVSHNHSEQTGGGIYRGVSGQLNIDQSNINDNNADDNGGGIWDDSSGSFNTNIAESAAPLQITRTSISRNSAYGSGGGLWHDDNGHALIANTTISGNHADVGGDGGTGGGIYQDGPPKPPAVTVGSAIINLINVTLAENEADGGQGGGIYTPFGSFELTNVLFANSTQGGAENNCGGGAANYTSNGNNLSTDDGTDCGLGSGDVTNVVNAKLGAIRNNGGPSETQALKDGSAAIDAGADGTCAADPVNGIDQRGYARPFGSHCDIGAYETGYADLAVVSNTDNPDPVGAGGNVAYTITVKNIGPSPDTATGVVLHNVNPAGTTFVSATPSQGTCSGSGPVDCALGSLGDGASATVVVTVKTSNPGTITDDASVTATTGDPDPSNNSASQSTTVLGAQAIAGAQACSPSAPRSSISRNGFQAKSTTVKLVGRTIDFRCLGQAAAGGIKRVRVAVALKVGSKCRFLKSNGQLTSARACSKRVYFRARLGTIRNGKVPWTFRVRHLNLPAGNYLAFASGIDSQNNKETQTRRYNRKGFSIH
jgi:uncharacterized repeat protein (TIGR01451 family)